MMRETLSSSNSMMTKYNSEIWTWHRMDSKWNLMQRSDLLLDQYQFYTKDTYCFNDCFCSIQFKPCRDCSGLQMVNFTMYEVQTFPDVVPKNSTDTLYITIQEVNDPPTMFVSRYGRLIQHADPTEPIVVCVEYSRECVVRSIIFYLQSVFKLCKCSKNWTQ